MNNLRRISFALPESDPASAVIGAWLDALPPSTDVSKLLRQVLANGIAATRLLERIESRLDSFTAMSTSLPALDTEEQALLGNMLDFSGVL